MRGMQTSVQDIRRRIFTEVARMGYEGGDYSRIEELPYKIVPGEVAQYRESIFLERAIVGERLRLAMGLPLRPMDEHAPLSMGVNESAIAEKYYEPPLINLIKFACHGCPEKQYRVTDCCQGCLAHPCSESCPKDAIQVHRSGQSVIDPEKCIRCGRCLRACPFDLAPAAMDKAYHMGNVDKLRELKVNLCMECGCCSYVCPAHRELAMYNKLGKRLLREAK